MENESRPMRRWLQPEDRILAAVFVGAVLLTALLIGIGPSGPGLDPASARGMTPTLSEGPDGLNP